MSSADFIRITHGGGTARAEGLFRAAISAFCCLTRPSRSEIAQLDDLAPPLFDHVSTEGRRFAAAALSECEIVPPGLLRRLADEPVEISAPLLMRSGSFKDIDLLGLIGRHGIGHARAIARRRQLSPAIANIVRALLARSETEQVVTPPQPRPLPDTAGIEAIRHQLRAMMQRPDAQGTPRQGAWQREADTYGKLRSAALTGVSSVFEAALAALLDLDHLHVRRMTSDSSYAMLVTALRALDLSVEQAFLVTAALFGRRFAHPETIRLFIERFESIDSEAARDTVGGWKADAMASRFAGEDFRAENLNRNARPGVRRA